MEERIADIIGCRIARVRKQRGLSQRQFGQQARIAQTEISLYEHGKMVPSAGNLVRIARAFNVSLDFLCGVENTLIPTDSGVLELSKRDQEMLMALWRTLQLYER